MSKQPMRRDGAPRTSGETDRTEYAGRAILAAGAVLLTAGGVIVANYASNKSSIDKLPSCSIPLNQGDTVSGIELRINGAGENAHYAGKVTILSSVDGKVVTPEQAAQPGDIVTIEHVTASACEEVVAQQNEMFAQHSQTQPN